MFDHSASDAEHLLNLLFPASPGISGLFCATNHLFDIFLHLLAERCANGYASRASRQAIFWSNDHEFGWHPFSTGPAAPRSGEVSGHLPPRLLWQLTKDGHIPCVRIGSGKRRTVLYPLADLQAWLTQQAATAKGAEQ